MKLIPSGKCRLRHSPQQILEAARSGGAQLQRTANELVEDLCKCTYFERTVFRYVLKNGGQRQQAEEVLEEGLIKLHELVLRGKYNGGKVEAFAIQICKNVWLNLRRRKDEQLELTDDPVIMDRPDSSTPEALLLDAEKAHVLGRALDLCLDENCRQLLYMKLIERRRHDEIASLLGLAGANSSKEKLNRCKKKALKCMEQSEQFEALLASVDVFFKKKSPYGS